MIGVRYDNPELKSLMLEGKSTIYKEIAGERRFSQIFASIPVSTSFSARY